MSQSTNFTTQKPQWFSTPWSKVVYELTEKNLNQSHPYPMSVVDNSPTRNTTLKQPQQDPQINLEE